MNSTRISLKIALLLGGDIMNMRVFMGSPMSLTRLEWIFSLTRFALEVCSLK